MRSKKRWAGLLSAGLVLFSGMLPAGVLSAGVLSAGVALADGLPGMGVGSAGLAGLPGASQPGAPMPGFKPYQTVNLGSNLEHSVIEVMAYECPYCMRLETAMLRWSATLPKAIRFDQMPAAIGKRWVPMTQGFYAAAVIDPKAIPRFNAAAFSLVQKQGYAFQDPRTYALAAEEAGIPPSLYREMLGYKGVRELVYNDEKIMLKTQIVKTPTLIICGRYLINPGDTKGNYSLFFQLANGLVSRCESLDKLKEPSQ